ncbi:MAG: histidinol dehydrogenase [Candidatus Omnitrophota bacterium]|jgi:histidinol dehydrogenase|nr:MAG: histidinol dehydrogenase [Candidatus Omnitrophota bacterium]
MINMYRWKETPCEVKRKILRRSGQDIDAFLPQAQQIIDRVKSEGDQAIVALTREFDGADLAKKGLRVSPNEIELAEKQLSMDVKAAIEISYRNIKKFHETQIPEEITLTEVAPGLMAGEKISPIESCVLYVPRGTAAYPSVLLMLGVPAKVAGVKRIAVATPPQADGTVDAASLYAARLIGIDEIYRFGGVQAVAAFALGTESIKPVLKMIGPSNIYASAAKKILYGTLDVGPPAGPSESIILADESSDADLVATDLLIEAEHGPYSAALVVTESQAVADAVANLLPEKIERLPQKQQEYVNRVLSNYGGIVLTESVAESVAFVNEYAPEHLEVLTSDPFALLGKLNNAGEIMLGRYTPISICNYSLGVNAILPTGGRAKTASVVTVFDYLKRTSLSYATKEGYESLRKHVAAFADFEGFPAHAAAVRIERK